MTTDDIVRKLWDLCHVLRDDGITYHQYLTELTYLLFLKMAKETGAEKQLPKGYRWDDLTAKEGVELLNFYRATLLHLGTEATGRVQAIFVNATTSLKQPKNLLTLVTEINRLDWYSAREEGLGKMYEDLLERNATEKKSGAGQYFTPRPLIDCIVRLVQPKAGELVQDPAAGTAGFLIAADRYVKERTDNLYELSEREQIFQRRKAFYGVELVEDAHRLALMNLMLHDIEGDIVRGDTLSPDGARLALADVILTNPPFGTKKGGGLPSRDDFTFLTSNKQLAFLQHVYRGLKAGGRAAMVVPDNVLFEENTGAEIRRDLMDKCDLHTILRLPTGIFYAQPVKTNVLFFTRGETDKGNTRAVWVYDMRANMPSFGKRTPLGRQHFAEFEEVFGSDPYGKSRRKDQGEGGRFRKFTRAEIKARGDNLDIAWLKDESVQMADDLPEPEDVAAKILETLRVATAEMEGLQAELGWIHEREPGGVGYGSRRGFCRAGSLRLLLDYYTTGWSEEKLAPHIEERVELAGESWAQYPTLGLSNTGQIVERREPIGLKSATKCRVIRTGDIVFNPIRFSIGSIARYYGDRPAIVSPEYQVFRTKSSLSSELLVRYLRTPRGRSHLETETQGSVRYRVYFRTLQEMSMPLAPPELQQQAELLLLGLRRVFEPVVAAIEEWPTSEAAILAKACGELAAQDSPDAPGAIPTR